MNCNSNVNEQFRKSVLVSVDDIGQTIETTNEESLLLGQTVYQSGTALELSESYHRIKRKGLYRADASVIFIPKEDASLFTTQNREGQCLYQLFPMFSSFYNINLNLIGDIFIRLYVF